MQGWSVSFFAGAGGYGVGHYLPLDGTVFKESRSVDTESLIGTISVGISIRRQGFTFSLAQTFRSKMLETACLPLTNWTASKA